MRIALIMLFVATFSFSYEKPFCSNQDLQKCLDNREDCSMRYQIEHNCKNVIFELRIHPEFMKQSTWCRVFLDRRSRNWRRLGLGKIDKSCLACVLRWIYENSFKEFDYSKDFDDE